MARITLQFILLEVECLILSLLRDLSKYLVLSLTWVCTWLPSQLTRTCFLREYTFTHREVALAASSHCLTLPLWPQWNGPTVHPWLKLDQKYFFSWEFGIEHMAQSVWAALLNREQSQELGHVHLLLTHAQRGIKRWSSDGKEKQIFPCWLPPLLDCTFFLPSEILLYLYKPSSHILFKLTWVIFDYLQPKTLN